MRIEYHRTLIADRVRIAAFHEALSRVVVKGKSTVADIGTGTGLLAFLAAKLGASGDIEMLEDLVAAACNDATRRAGEAAKEKMSGLMGGMPLPPGMKLF